ncbi:cTPxI [Tulasnella sp. 419]|nr:cTPxI [Tulasnella sp. 419]
MSALVQRPAPAFKGTVVQDGLFKEISLSDYVGKWVVLFFYPMDFTFVCPTEILAFNNALPEFEALNTKVIGTRFCSDYIQNFTKMTSFLACSTDSEVCNSDSKCLRFKLTYGLS